MLASRNAHLAAKIREVPDFPTPGISFKDITPLMADPAALGDAIDQIVRHYQPLGIDHVVGIESRGFIFGAAIAYALKAGFIPVRKPGKLPSPTHRCDYALEYGTDALEIHQDAVKPGERVLIVDDVLATGGTATAAVELVRKLDGHVVGLGFLIELSFLEGRKRLPEHEIVSLISY